MSPPLMGDVVITKPDSVRALPLPPPVELYRAVVNSFKEEDEQTLFTALLCEIIILLIKHIALEDKKGSSAFYIGKRVLHHSI